MKTTANALAIALFLSARLVAATHAQTYDDIGSANSAHAAVSSSGFYSPYSPSDQYTDAKGFPLGGWSQLKLPNE